MTEEKIMKKRQYLHFRPDRKIERPNKTVETIIDSCGGATVCYLPLKGSEEGNVVMGVSFCSPRDNFVNKKGREQSLRAARAGKKRGEYWALLSWEDFVEEAEKMVKQAAENSARIEREDIEKIRKITQELEDESKALLLNISRVKPKIRQKI
jgi:hypothetical protein